MRVLVVVPTYDEADNIVALLRRLRAAVPFASVLVVDDSSPDGTGDIVEAAAQELGSIELLRREKKDGLGAAYRDGFRLGISQGYDTFVEMDADLSHDPSQLPRLLEAIENGADLAIGSRYVSGGSIPRWTLYRRMLSRWGNRYASAMLGLHIHDCTSGFRVYKRAMLETLDLDSVRADGYGFQIEMTYNTHRLGCTIAERPIDFADRAVGESKMSGHIVIEALFLVTWWAFRDRVLRPRKL